MMMVTLHDQEHREEWETEDAEQRWARYQKSEGVARRHRRAMKAAQEPPEARATLAEFRQALEAHGKTLATLKDVTRRLGRGSDRWQATRLGIAAGFRKAEMARLLGVSRQRIDQILSEDDSPF